MTTEGGGVAPGNAGTQVGNAPQIRRIDHVHITGFLARCGDPIRMRVLLTTRGFGGMLRLRFMAPDGSEIDRTETAVNGQSMLLVDWTTRKIDDAWTDAPDAEIRASLHDTSGSVVHEHTTPHRVHVIRPNERRIERCVPGGQLRGERWVRPTGSTSGAYTWAQDRPYGWDANYHVEFRQGVFYVVAAIKLAPENGLVLSQQFKQRWKQDIETFWNQKFYAHRQRCGRGAACADRIPCCKHDVRVECNFVDSNETTVVRVKPGQCPGPWGAPEVWWYSNLWWELPGSPNPTGQPAPNAHIHEFGHNIGLWDEYLTPDNSGALQPGFNPNTMTIDNLSIMGNGTAARPQHFQIWLQSMVPLGAMTEDRYSPVPMPSGGWR